MKKVLPFYDINWPLFDRTQIYFYDAEEGDVLNPMADHEVRNIYSLYNQATPKDRIYSLQCVCFLLDHAPMYTTDRKEIAYFLLRPYLIQEENIPETRKAQVERAALSVDVMDLFQETRAIFDNLNFGRNFNVNDYDSRAADVMRIETIVSFETELAEKNITNPHAYVPNTMDIIQKLEGSENVGIQRYFEGLQDKLIDLYSQKPQEKSRTIFPLRRHYP